MLLNVHVQNLALIEDVDIYFKDGLNIMTGETGAGKSIIIGSINIALGGKVPKDIIRNNSEYGLIELVFSVDDECTLEKIKELGIDVSDNTVIIVRKITDNRSVTKINGESVTLSKLKEVAMLLLDVHGQHDHESLLHKSKHLEILDDFIKEDGLNAKEQVKNDYSEYKKLIEKLESYDVPEETRAREMSFLEFEINEIDEASLVEDEDVKLEEEQKFIDNASKLMNSLQYAKAAMSDDDQSVYSLVSGVARELSRISSFNDDTKHLYDCIMDIDSIINDFNSELSNYIEGINFDEERVEFVYKRLNIINKLKLKHGNSILEILNKRDEFEEKLKNYIHYEESIALLNKEIEKAKNKLDSSSKKLSQIRQKAAEDLSERIENVLKTLNFNHVEFKVNFDNTTDYTSKGIDDVSFMISTNVGETMKSLDKVASGGELSRIMLGIKTILAQTDNIGTLIFDEIDTGISGKTAQLVAEKMSIISKHHQVICITHLPQIAAMADNHFLIEKNTVDGYTKTEISKLNEDDSIMELARMLGGATITEAVIQNAKELKKNGISNS